MHVLLRITKLATLSPGRMVIAWVTLLLSTALFLAVPWLIGEAIDQALPREGAAAPEIGLPFFADLSQTQVLVALGGLVIVAVALRGIFTFVNLYLAEAISQRVSYHIRNLLYDKLQHLSFAFHDREHTGNLMSKATVDVEMMRMFVSMGLIRSGQIVTLVIGAAIMMLLIDWMLGLIGLLFVPLIAFRAIIASTRLRMLWRKAQIEMGRMTTVLQENLSGQRVVKAFGAEAYEEAKFAERNQDVFDWTFSARRHQAINSSIMQFIFWGSTGLILWVGGYAVMNDRISIGELGSFIFYTSLLVQPVRMVGFLVNTFARAISAGERLFDVLDAPSPVQERDDAKVLKDVRGHVTFDDVTFSYGDRPALHGVSLDVPPGQVVALLGAPGSGKSTLASMLARFYDVTGGSVRLDGIDVRDITLSSLRSAVGIVQQDV
ncbi:MAG: ABC transporter transmembrane domain-containing protein, partial [Dehalococcoidia bacterium]